MKAGRSRAFRRWTAGWAFLLASAAQAEILDVEVLLAGQGAPAAPVVGEVVLTVGELDPRVVRIEVRGRTEVEVPPGSTVRLTVAAPGYWTPVHVLHVSGPSALRVVLAPTGWIAGELVVPAGEVPPEEVQVTVRASPASPGVPETTWTCPVDAGAFRCEVPSGNLDLKIRAKEFVSHHVWGQQVPRHRTFEVGTLRLEPGASVVGWVEAPTREFRFDEVEVVLTPLPGATVPSASDHEKAAALRQQAAVSARGFFELTGVAPGSYAVTVRHPDYATSRIAPVQVMERSETSIRRITLSPPAFLDLLLAPPHDPFVKPWRVTLARVGNVPGRLEEAVEGVASSDGTWRFEGLEAGEYVLDVHDSRGSRWLRRPMTLDSAAEPLRVDLPFDRLEGTLLLGDEPLSAFLHFGGRSGPLRIRLRSDEEGKFFAFLPRQEEPWMVDVEAPDLGLSVRVEEVDVERLPGQPWATTTIELPDTRVRGVVVDASGEPLAGAVVEAVRGGGHQPSVRSADPDGTFELAGLDPGVWRVQARHAREGRRLSSRAVRVEVQEDEVGEALRLVLHPDSKLSGLVVSASGAGVPGARILARLENPHGRLVRTMPSGSTDVDGVFELRLPHGTGRVVLSVLAPGFALRSLPVDTASSEPLVVPLDQVAGTVTVVYEGGGLAPEVRRHRTELFRPHQVAASWQLVAWAQAHGVAQSDPNRFVVPMLEPGTYTACYDPGEAVLLTGWLPEGDLPSCASGHLAPYGELVLALPVPEE